jgi:hypothetical protein
LSRGWPFVLKDTSDHAGRGAHSCTRTSLARSTARSRKWPGYTNSCKAREAQGLFFFLLLSLGMCYDSTPPLP